MIDLDPVSPDQIKELRKELSCTAKELAGALNVEHKEIMAWEAGELFPTKRYVLQMEALRKKGPSAIARAPRGKAAALTGVARLSDPKLWEVVQKLVSHPALFDQVVALAKGFGENAEGQDAKAAKKD
jgi:transcriptional regulator with XRE-family HTH domain